MKKDTNNKNKDKFPIIYPNTLDYEKFLGYAKTIDMSRSKKDDYENTVKLPKNVSIKDSSLYNLGFSSPRVRTDLLEDLILENINRELQYKYGSDKLNLFYGISRDESFLKRVVNTMINIIAETIKEMVFFKPEKDDDGGLVLQINDKIIETVISKIIDDKQSLEHELSRSIEKNAGQIIRDLASKKESITMLLSLVSYKVSMNPEFYRAQLDETQKTLLDDFIKNVVNEITKKIDVDIIYDGKLKTLNAKCRDFIEKDLKNAEIYFRDKFVPEAINEYKPTFLNNVKEEFSDHIKNEKTNILKFFNDEKAAIKYEISSSRTNINDEKIKTYMSLNNLYNKVEDFYETITKDIEKNTKKNLKRITLIIDEQKSDFNDYIEKTKEANKNQIKFDTESIKKDFENIIDIKQKEINSMMDEVKNKIDSLVKSIPEPLPIMPIQFENQEDLSIDKDFNDINNINDYFANNNNVKYDYLNSKIDSIEEKLKEIKNDYNQKSKNTDKSIDNHNVDEKDTIIKNKIHKFLNMKRHSDSNSSDLNEKINNNMSKLSSLNTNHNFLDNNDIKILKEVFLR